MDLNNIYADNLDFSNGTLFNVSQSATTIGQNYSFSYFNANNFVINNFIGQNVIRIALLDNALISNMIFYNNVAAFNIFLSNISNVAISSVHFEQNNALNPAVTFYYGACIKIDNLTQNGNAIINDLNVTSSFSVNRAVGLYVVNHDNTLQSTVIPILFLSKISVFRSRLQIHILLIIMPYHKH